MGGMGVSGLNTDTSTDVGKCMSGGSELASVAESTAINTTTWLQPFTITGLATGTCTFYLFDNNGNTNSGAGTESQAVTVTVTP
jgi:hypothetical protein